MDNNQKNQSTSLNLPVSLIISIIAIIISLYSLYNINAIKNDIEYQTAVEISTTTDNETVNSEKDQPDNSGIIKYPYFNGSQNVSGIVVSDKGDGTILVSGQATEDNVVFRFISNDTVVEIPLENKVYTFYQGGDEYSYSEKCRIDIGLMKKDGKTEIKSCKGNSIEIDNSDGEYSGIFALSIYCKKDYSIPDGYGFKPSLVSAN